MGHRSEGNLREGNHISQSFHQPSFHENVAASDFTMRCTTRSAVRFKTRQESLLQLTTPHIFPTGQKLFTVKS